MCIACDNDDDDDDGCLDGGSRQGGNKIFQGDSSQLGSSLCVRICGKPCKHDTLHMSSVLGVIILRCVYSKTYHWER